MVSALTLLLLILAGGSQGFTPQASLRLKVTPHLRPLPYASTSYQQASRLFASSSSSSQDDDISKGETNAGSTAEEGGGTSFTVTSTSSSTTNTNSTFTTTAVKFVKSLWLRLNELGASFKPKAQKATAKGCQATTKSAQFGYGLQACLYYSLFILYRAYRGFFVLLPAVFRQVYMKMEAAMNSSDLALEETEEELMMSPQADGSSSSSAVASTPANQTSWRTKITVSVLAGVVTVSYILGGTLQMATRFVKTLTKSSSVPKSFEAAADGMVDYEFKIGRIGNQINGEGLEVDMDVDSIDDRTV